MQETLKTPALEEALGYWQVRTAILDALKTKNDEELRRLGREYPGVFQNVVQQAKNSTAKRG